MTITFHHQNNRSKYIIIYGILIGCQWYLNLLIIMDLHTSDPHTNTCNYMQYSMLHDPEFSHLCNKEFLEKWRVIKPKKYADLHLELKNHLEAGSILSYLRTLWNFLSYPWPATLVWHGEDYTTTETWPPLWPVLLKCSQIYWWSTKVHQHYF